MSEDALFAAGSPYAGGNSRLDRSLRVRKQLRDSKGRWIYMGGNLALKLKLKNGKNTQVFGKNIGASDQKPGYAQVYISGHEADGIPDGFYLARGDKSEVFQAVLSPEELKKQGIALPDISNTDPELQDIGELTPIDAPEGWTKNADGSYSTPDGLSITFNKDTNKWSLNEDGIPQGEYSNPGDAFSHAADMDAEASLNADEQKKIADLKVQQDKLNNDFTKTTNPEAMARIEKKLETVDGGIKDILRNKPADAAPEGPKPGDIFELKNLDSAPNGTTIDYTHTIKSKDGNDYKIDTTYQKNDQGDWINLDDNTKANQQLKAQANELGKHIGEYKYAEAPKMERVAELPTAVEAPTVDMGDYKAGDRVDIRVLASSMSTSPGKVVGPSETPGYIIVELDKAPLGLKNPTTVPIKFIKHEGTSFPESKEAAYKKAISDNNSPKERALAVAAKYDDKRGTVTDLINSGAGKTEVLDKLREVSPEWKAEYDNYHENQSKDFPSQEEKARWAAWKAEENAVYSLGDKAETPEATLPEGPKDLSSWKQVGGQKGSNKGGLYEGPNGEQAYVKFQDAEHANNEILASKLYKLAGIDTAEVDRGTLNGEDVTYSPIVEGTQGFNDKLDDPQFMEKLQDGFAADAWLANWDVAGLDNDNVVVTPDNKPVRIDQGGALAFRAQGQPKGKAFGDKANEVDTMVDLGTNPQAAKVFQDMTPEQKKASAMLIGAGATDAKISEAVQSVYGDTPEAKALTEKLIARRQDVIARLTGETAAPAAPQGVTKDVANIDFFKEDGTVNPDAISVVEKALNPETAPAPSVEASPMPAPGTGGLVQWEDWSYSAPVGTIAYGIGTDGVERKLEKVSESEWNITYTDNSGLSEPMTNGLVAFVGNTSGLTSEPSAASNTEEVFKKPEATKQGNLIGTVSNAGNSRIYDANTSQTYGTIVPTVNDSFDAIYTPADGGTQKANFKSEYDAKVWLGDMVSKSLDEKTNFFTDKPLGEKDLKPTVHKGGFLNAASDKQIDAVNNLLEGKEIDAARKQEIKNLLTKPGLNTGEIGSIIGELKKLPDVPNPESKPRESADTTPAVENPQINPVSPKDVLDANLIMDQVKKDNPDHQELSDSDVQVASNTYTNKYGKTFKYDLIVHRTEKERFYAYVRETDVQSGVIRTSKVTKEVHSYQALKNKLAASKSQIMVGKDPRNWFQKRTNIETAPSKSDGLPTNVMQPDFVEGTNVPKSQDENKNQLASLINTMVQNDAATTAVLEALAASKGFTPDVATDIYDTIIGVKVTNMSIPSGVAPSAPYVSYDGKTQVKAGDYVDWTDNDPNSSTFGQVFRGQVKNLISSEHTKGYLYSDTVWAIFPEHNKAHGYPASRQRKRVTSGLQVVDQGAPLSAPVQPKAKEAAEQGKLAKIAADYPKTEEAGASKPHVSAPAAPAEPSYDTEGQAFIDTPAGPLEVPTSIKDVAEIVPTGTDIEITPQQMSVGDYFPVFPEGMPFPTMAKTVSVSKSSDGGVTVDYVYFDNNKTLQKKSTLYTPNLASQLKLSIKRPGEVPAALVPESDAGPIWKNDPATNKQFYVIKDLSNKKQIPPALQKQIDDFYAQDFKSKGDASDIISQFGDLKDVTPAAPEKSTTAEIAQAVSELSNAVKTVENSGVDTQAIDDATANGINSQADAYGGYPVKTIEMKDIVYSAAKKNAPFSNIKKLSVSQLEPGDLIPKGTGTAKYYLQVLSVEDISANQNGSKIEYITRTISNNPTFNGEIKTTNSWWSSSSFNNVKRPTPFAGKDYVIEGDGGIASSGDPVSTSAAPEIVKQDSFTNVIANAEKTGEKAFFEKMGVPSEINGAPLSSILGTNPEATLWNDSFVDMNDPIGIKTSTPSGTFSMIPGSVVRSMDKGSSGIITNVEHEPTPQVTVSWLTGSKAGTSEILFSDKVRPTPYWATPEKAEEMGVSVDTAAIDKGKANVTAKVDEYKKQYADQIAKQAELAEYNKMKAKLTVEGTGAAPVEPTDTINWDYKASDQISSVDDAITSVKNGEFKQFGIQTLVDSGEIEDNKVRVSSVTDSDGTKKIRLEFTATAWAADAHTDGTSGITQIAADSGNVVKSNGIQYPKFDIQSDGTLKKIGTWSNSYIDSSLVGATYTVPLNGPDGSPIGYYLLHRGNKDSSSVEFDASKKSGSSPLSYHNKVDVYLNESASSADVEYALSKIGVSASRPATREDVKVTVENKIIDLFTGKMDGSKNYTGELREKALADFEKRFGITASDVEIVQDGSDVFYLLPEKFGQDMAKKTGTTYFNHGWTASNLKEPGEERAQQLFDMLTQTGLRPTTSRWAHGINVGGMSSQTDGYNHGAGYVYTKKGNVSSGGVTFQFDASRLLRRLDLYANANDSFGAKKKNDIEKTLSYGSVYEVLFKDTISWADLASLRVDSKTRAILLKKLLDSGVKNFGDKPVEEILGKNII